MALNPNERVQAGVSWTPDKRYNPTEVKPRKFAAGTGTIDVLTPLAINSSTGQWVVWSATDGTNQISTVTINATGGTFTITFNGQTTGAIAWNASAATVQTALEGLDNVLPGDVAVTGGVGGTNPFSITTPNTSRIAKTAFTVTTNAGSLTGGTGTAAVATPTAAAAGVGISVFRGFKSQDPITLDPAYEKEGNVMLAGEVHADDVVLPDGEQLSDLQAMLRTQTRAMNIKVQGLSGVQ